MNQKTIVLTGGGTAGHIMPNIALAPYLKYYFENVIYIGAFGSMEEELAKRHGIPYFPVTTVKLRRSLTLANLKIPFLLRKGTSQAIEILRSVNADVVFSKGGFAALPAVRAAKKFKIPYVLHESDMSLGLANKLCVRRAAAVCTAFPETARQIKNGIYTGIPMRQELFSGSKIAAKQLLKFESQRPIILVMGGSIGSKKINAALRENLSAITKNYNIIHITGKGNLLGKKLAGYREFEFTDTIQDLYAAADLVVARSGSNTINELLALRKPMLLIPLSKRASRGDQIENAESFLGQGFCNLLYEEKLNAKSLAEAIDLTFNTRNILVKNMHANAGVNGVKKVLEVILNAAGMRLEKEGEA